MRQDAPSISRPTLVGLFLLGALVVLAPASPGHAQERARSRGQRVYVPVYSEIPYGAGRATTRLGATISIRNTDPKARIRVLRADYFDSEGQLIEAHLKEPVRLGPLGSTHVVVRQADRKGGVGANFIVEWRSDEAVAPPMIQAIMVSHGAASGTTFLSESVVIDELGPSPRR